MLEIQVGLNFPTRYSFENQSFLFVQTAYNNYQATAKNTN